MKIKTQKIIKAGKKMNHGDHIRSMNTAGRRITSEIRECLQRR